MIPKTVERTQLTDPLLALIAVITNCVSAVFALVMRRGRGGHYRLLRFELPVVSSVPYNTQECRASPLHAKRQSLGRVKRQQKKAEHSESSSV